MGRDNGTPARISTTAKSRLDGVRGDVDQFKALGRVIGWLAAQPPRVQREILGRGLNQEPLTEAEFRAIVVAPTASMYEPEIDGRKTAQKKGPRARSYKQGIKGIQKPQTTGGR